MTTNELPSAHSDPSLPPNPAAAVAPQLGDVIDGIQDTAATLKSVVRNETDSLLNDFRDLIRDQPIASVAVAGTLAFLIGRIGR
ncbi:MAG TPA: hypothetical protein VFN25_11825 [Dokdonella sp.]|uniref:hypothetical protein n=1 Tax=Dokdonella sp. TaxID=2291710 RepID=UPI002D80D879|nr:hypothetical protein [Dokdonella sp.]HET9033584.1 hypothetical protein [Dokdonella sp.]